MHAHSVQGKGEGRQKPGASKLSQVSKGVTKKKAPVKLTASAKATPNASAAKGRGRTVSGGADPARRVGKSRSRSGTAASAGAATGAAAAVPVAGPASAGPGAAVPARRATAGAAGPAGAAGGTGVKRSGRKSAVRAERGGGSAQAMNAAASADMAGGTAAQASAKTRPSRADTSRTGHKPAGGKGEGIPVPPEGAAGATAAAVKRAPTAKTALRGAGKRAAQASPRAATSGGAATNSHDGENSEGSGD